MSKLKKTWCEKLADSKGLPRVERVSGRMVGRFGTREEDTFVIPSPMEVDGLMRQVRRGKVVTINELRQVLAKRHGTTIACPVTTGIFAWIAAHAAEESAGVNTTRRARRATKTGSHRGHREHRGDGGEGKMTPYWRTLKVGGEINAKYPGGVAAVARKLRAEGHRVVRKGKRWLVADYERVLGKVG